MGERVIWKALSAFVLCVLTISPAFASDTTNGVSSETNRSSDSVPRGELSSSSTADGAEGAAAAFDAAAAALDSNEQGRPSDQKKTSATGISAPAFVPMLATTGTLGLFTAETADTLPRHALLLSTFGDKFGRMPGSVTILEFGVDLSYGITDRLNFYGSFDPYGHVHVGCGQQLSLAPPNALNPVYGNTIFHSVLTVPTPPCAGNIFAFTGTPGFVEDYPFAANDTGGTGNATLGLKYALLSQPLGDPLSVSVRNDVIISTKTGFNKILANGTQASPLSDMVSVAVSRQWGSYVTSTFNFGFMYTRAPRDDNGNILFQMADQVHTSAGLLFRPQSRVQPMIEYNGVIFNNGFVDTVYGARDPIDSVSGLRIYARKDLAIDIGYRYMLNLRDLNDRYGFVVKIGGGYWPGTAPSAENHPPTVSCSADSPTVSEGSNEAVTITCDAADPDNDPLTFTWSSTGGHVDGSGSKVRWTPSGSGAGTYTITAIVDDGRGGAARSNVAIRVQNR